MLHGTLVAAAAALTTLAAMAGTTRGETMAEARAIVANRAPLAPTPYVRLPIGSVRADGWLLRQLQLQRDGLTGSAEQIYDALTPESSWLGGKGEGWEKGPYYVKGLVALANTLDDATLKERSTKWIDWTLKSQRDDGWFGPANNDDWWPRMVVLFYLRDHYEATGDARVVPFLTNYFHYQLANLPQRPLKDWGKARAGDNLDVVLWLYNRTGDAKLIELGKLLTEQAYPWTSIFTDDRFYGFGEDFQPHHIVNVSQALKFSPVAWQLTKRDADKNAFAAGVANLEAKYGRIDGQVSGTEFLSGKASTDGVELCADAERIVSNGIAATILGDAALGDQMERVAYNSLPGHTSAEMRQITYYQLPNQVVAARNGHGFKQDYPNGIVPGPHSGFPCCCYNWHMGWPKLVEGMWAATSDGGVVAIAYGPNRLTTSVAGGVPLTVAQATDYPFAEGVTLKVDPQRPATFPLVLRVPGWCDAPEIKVNGEAVSGVRAGTFHRVQREWKSGDVVSLNFPMKVRASTWANGSVGLTRGPIAFGLRIGEEWRKVSEFLQNFDEFEVHPTTPWNYALQLDRDAPQVEVKTSPVGAVPFASDAPPVVLRVPARRVPGWGQRAQLGTAVLGRVDGAWHQLDKADVTLAPDVPHRLRVEVKGAAFKVFVDDMDKPAITRDEGGEAIASGGVGLRSYRAAATYRDVTLDGKPVAVADFAKGWQAFGGKWSAAADAVTIDQTNAAGDGKAIVRGPRDLRDFTLEATITLKVGGDAGLIFRASNVTPQRDGFRGYYVGLAARSSQDADAAEPPASPVTSAEPVETVELVPFGSSKLRVSYFPTLAR